MTNTGGDIQYVGSYTVGPLLHRGETSNLYRGQQGQKEVVIRVFHTPLITSEAQTRYVARAKQLKKLKHRSIVEIYDGGLTPQRSEFGCLVMQYITAGTPLTGRIAAGQQLAPDEVKRFLSPVASALHYAHVSQIVHANLHPGNLLIDSNNQVLLTDFSPLFADMLAAPEQQPAALPYMSPEQLRGAPSAAGDQYALAVMAYEWLCGQRPFDATERAQLLDQQEHAAFPLPHELNPAVSPAVERVLLHALNPDPAERFPHIQDFADQYLHALLGMKITLAKPVGAKPIEMTSVETKPVVAQFIAPVSATPSPIRAILPMSVSSPAPVVRSAANGHQRNDKAEVAKQNQEQDYFEELDAFASLAESDDEEADRLPVDPRLGEIVVADLAQGGVLSRSLPGYEERPSQIEMATVVAQSLIEEVKAVLEAPTGVGKSLAYLLPIVRSGQVAIISTANKALQEQLYYKDIPFVQKHIKHVEAVLYKGMGNYVCLDRLENERVGLQFYAQNREFTRLVELTLDERSSFNGDFETLDFQVPADIRGKVGADSDQCAWKKCNYYNECYVRKMRAKAERAQIIVVNHTLLLLDAAMEGYFLPERDIIVVDEAHHLEEEATRAFTITVSPNSVRTLLNQRMLKDHSQVSLQDDAEAALGKAWEQLHAVADPGFKGRANLLEPLEDGLKLATVIGDLANSLIKHKPINLTEKDEQLYNKLVKRTQNLSENMRTVFSVADRQRFVYYVERVTTGGGQRGNQLQVSAAPLEVSEWLRERLFNKSNVICTSATLATIGSTSEDSKGPGFAYFRRRVGLDTGNYPDVQERILPLTFDYENNALLYVPRDLPEPAYGAGSEQYITALARRMYDLVKCSRGRAFLLFSSKRALDLSFELMAPHLDFPLLKQGDLSRLELTRRFRAEQGSVLFGLKSFWEGVDIAGDALSLVVIDKLPFDPPDDPVHEARVAQMKAAGENWFGTYVLPQAVLRLKQGLGRLLRARDDRGVMAILDVRLYTKGYGKLVLDALPPARRTSDIRQVKLFFDEDLKEG
ncbi:MAG: helicase C-terminal domain-containing protein [Ktedonobacteraceae bacterium]